MKSQLMQKVEQLSHNGDAETLKNIRRGIERESLRVNPDAKLATTVHPAPLGSPLTHSFITTDFAEAMLEFITPAKSDAHESLELLADIHRFTYRHLDRELLWPISMPCRIEDEDRVILAQYGNSALGKQKTDYRVGLKRRYGSIMQLISGVHYNFSIPEEFWPVLQAIRQDNRPLQEFISESYFGLIRNVLRYGWILLYLFGASPVVDETFPQNSRRNVSLIPSGRKSWYLPQATSLRMSDLGYSSALQDHFSISYNSLNEFIRDLRNATKNNGDNLYTLQQESELYEAIRPKRVVPAEEQLSDALEKKGVQYVEIRCLDVNPYSATGIDLEQIRFLDTFLTYCLIKESPAMSKKEYQTAKQNQKNVAMRGRNTSLILQDGNHRRTLENWARELVSEAGHVASLLDLATTGQEHQDALGAQVAKINNPSLTPSARILQDMRAGGFEMTELALVLSHMHREQLLGTPYTHLTEGDFLMEALKSKTRQMDLESAKPATPHKTLKRACTASQIFSSTAPLPNAHCTGTCC